MSIAVLGQVYDELRRLAIAGSVVVPGDFRIKKLIHPLEQAGKKSPIFVKVLMGVKNLAEATEHNASQALLELGTLVNAILYTQGETSLAGKLEPIVSKQFGTHKTQTSARAMKPLLEALTTTGSGRLEIIRDAVERNLFHDLRLIRPALLALDDSYADISDLVAKNVLPIYGSAIVPELQAQFNVKGKYGAARRLLLMHQLDPQSAREYVQKALEEGSSEVRVAAIECLGTADEDLTFLLEQLKARARGIRLAAIKGLCRMSALDAATAICKVIDGAELEFVTDVISKCKHPAVVKHLIAETTSQLDVILSGKIKEKKEVGELVAKTDYLLHCFTNRDDADSEKLLLTMFADREKFAAVKGDPSGNGLMEHLVNVMATSSLKVMQVLVAGHRELGDKQLGTAFRVACNHLKPAEVFQQFSPYLTAKVDEKKKFNDPAYAKREIITNAITNIYHYVYYRINSEPPLASKLDPQWVKLAIKLKHVDLILATAVEGNADSNAALAKLIPEQLHKVKHSHEAYHLFLALARVKHPELTNAVFAAIEKDLKTTDADSLRWLGHFIAQLPKEEALPRMEALLPTSTGRAQDAIVDFILDLKAK